MRSLSGAVALVLLGLTAATASARPQAPAAACSGGLRPAVVGGFFACLKAGTACRVKLAPDYARAGFLCRAGHLRAKVGLSAGTLSPAGAGSSRANPVPLGKAAALGNGWVLTITGVNDDAAAAIAVADPSNPPPLAGMREVLVSVSATYTGGGSSHLTPATTFRAIGASGFVHTSANSFCGKLPAPNLDLDNPLVFKDGTISGYAACWLVSADDLDSLELSYQPPLAGPLVWFALD